MEKELEFLNAWQQQINKHIGVVSDFLNDCSSISKDYIKSKEDDQKEMFNVFHIISDLYYRENFHSDIISFFLNPTEKHGGGSVYLNTFIEMLNKTGKNIDSNDYKDAIVTREEGTIYSRIDILIKSEATKKAIIIENKINNAPDMHQQMPRYYEYVTQNSYIVDAIVYLPLDIQKEPDKAGWTQEDENKVKPLLVTIPAYDKSGKINLVKDWLQPSILLSNDIDVVSTLRQYSILIKKLNSNIMDNIVLEKFYENLLQNDNLQTAQSIRNMMNDLPRYLAFRIQEQFGENCSPFSKISIYSNNDAVFEGAIINNVYYNMDIWCAEDGYSVYFGASNNKSYDKISEIEFINFIKSLKSLSDYITDDDKFHVKKHFDFSDERELNIFIDQLLEELRALSSQNK